MRAQAVVCDQGPRFGLQEVELPDPGERDVVIRALWSGVSIGTEMAVVTGKLDWGPFPLCTGYMGVGVVEHAGPAATGFAVGDVVYHRGNPRMSLPGGGRLTSASGGHCSHVVVDPNHSEGAGHVPAGLAADVASIYVPAAVGLHGVDMANPRLGETVVVQGVGLVGLGVVGACAHRGCRVVAVDVVPQKLEVARRLGAAWAIDGSRQDVAAEVRRLAPAGADVVFECTGVPVLLDQAVGLCRPHGVFVWQGNYGAAPVSFHFLPAHGRQLRMHFPCHDGLKPCRDAVLANMARGALPWGEALTQRLTPEEAPSFFGDLASGRRPEVIGAAIRWGG